MSSRAVLGIVLSLLLMGLLTLGFGTQAFKADAMTSETEQVRIIEHRITPFELEELKRRIGVGEQGGNYIWMIDSHGTGLRQPTEEEWAEIAKKAYVVEEIQLDQSPPYSVDHVAGPWFPPIGDQDGEGSCVGWAVGYYVKTFQEAKEHGWDLSEAEWIGGFYGHPTPEYQDRIFSPDFIYHLINGGVDKGSYYDDAIALLRDIGASSWEKMPYDPLNSTRWPSEDAWREAPVYRCNSSGYEYLLLDTDADIASLKNWIASDHLALIGVDSSEYDYLTSQDVWTLENYFISEIDHANTIVGYDDSFSYTEEGELRYGAFRIANSWGEGGSPQWENIADGCYWISYEAMKQRVGACSFYRDRIGYDPKLLASFEIDHSEREECNILIGVGDHIDPSAAKSFSDSTDGGSQMDHPFCPNSIVLDVTEFEDAIPSVLNQSFFTLARAGIPSPHSGVYEWYSEKELDAWFWFNQTFEIPETGASLRFWNYFEIEKDWDYGYVEVHDLDTDEWGTLTGINTVTTLPNSYETDNPNCPPEFEPSAYYDAGRWNAFTGYSGVMYEEEMDLTAFANHTIELYFTYWTDYIILGSGWYIDDIEIPEIGFFDDVESGADGWEAHDWHITTPPPSTDGTLLSFSIEYYESYISESMNTKSRSHDTPLTFEAVLAELILKVLGDVDGDGDVDAFDLFDLCKAFGSQTGETSWNPECDLDWDDDVDVSDLIKLSENYGKIA